MHIYQRAVTSFSGPWHPCCDSSSLIWRWIIRKSLPREWASH